MVRVECKFWLCVCFVCALPFARGAPWETELLRGVKIRHSDAIALGRDAESQATRDLQELRSARPSAQHMLSAPPSCATCNEKDYSDLCPLHWMEVGGERCEAPASYVGLCNNTLSLVGLTGDAKQEVEVVCSVCWPCNDSCDRDYALPCPNGYTSKSMSMEEYGDAIGDACVATSDTSCEFEISFRDAAEKESFARRCSTSWPCVSTCAASVCPIDWIEIGDGMCVAPPTYKRAGCGVLLQDTLQWSHAEKLEFAKSCGVRWQCAIGGPDSDIEVGNVARSSGSSSAQGGGRAPDHIVVADGPL